MLEVNGFIKHSEEDNYENGCELRGASFFGDDRFTAETEAELLKQLMDFVGVTDKSCVTVNACGEAGRIDIQRMENADGLEPSDREFEAFKTGDCRLWLCDYSFYAEKVNRKTFTFSKNLGFDSN